MQWGRGSLASPSSFLLPTVNGSHGEINEWNEDGEGFEPAPPPVSWTVSYSRIHNSYVRVRELGSRKTSLHCVLLWLLTRASAVFITRTLRRYSMILFVSPDSPITAYGFLFTINRLQSWRSWLCTCPTWSCSALQWTFISLVNDASRRCVGDTCSHHSAITHYKKLRRACLWFEYV